MEYGEGGIWSIEHGVWSMMDYGRSIELLTTTLFRW